MARELSTRSGRQATPDARAIIEPVLGQMHARPNAGQGHPCGLEAAGEHSFRAVVHHIPKNFTSHMHGGDPHTGIGARAPPRHP